jgi:hypothetical protein
MLYTIIAKHNSGNEFNFNLKGKPCKTFCEKKNLENNGNCSINTREKGQYKTVKVKNILVAGKLANIQYPVFLEVGSKDQCQNSRANFDFP